jgi:aminoglycoside 2'-N-acetyltransferase I
VNHAGAFGTELAIHRLSSTALTPGVTAAILELCDSSYGQSMETYFEALGRGEHLLGWHDGDLVTHLMWVTRWLQPGNQALLRTAYVELVATVPAARRRGYATLLLEYFPSQVQDFELAALSPATENLYARLGWRPWQGPLAARTDHGLVPTPDEEVMILALPHTPMLYLTLPLSIEWRAGEVW